MSPPEPSVSFFTAKTALVLAGVWLVYKLLEAAYNVSPLHPLSHVPGPKLAAATYLPEFYHDVVLFGRYTNQIRQMHEQYGPIVRINPNEVHCNDANFADDIYAVAGRKRDKPVHQINGSALGQAGFGTVDHDVHRLRRIPLAKFFSRSMIARLEGDIQAQVQKLCDKLLAQSGKKHGFDITMAYSCFTADAISGYCFGDSFGFLAQEAVTGKWFVNYLPADIALFIQTLQIDIPNQIKKTKAEMDAGIIHDRPTVFGSLLESDLQAHEKQPQRLSDEATAVVGAGTETTSWALSIITYHLLTKPELLARITAELNANIENSKELPSWTVLEKLPYLGAVLQEGLRLSYGVSARTARIATEENLVYRGEFNKRPVEYVIPQGYAVGMSAAITHHDETVFPDSESFSPERWLDENNQRRKDVERGMLAFSKGSRACLGMK
ncbi:hypothetical protein ACHAP6_002484 [Verticillium nonalfalfae]